VRNLEEANIDSLKKLVFLLLLMLFMFVLLILAVFLLSSKSAEATTVRGHITADTSWNVSGNPYIVQGDVFIDVGVTLTIEPGTNVTFDGYYSLVVNGNLIAKGNQLNIINFTSGQSSPSSSNWNTIKVQVNGYSEFDFCEISYAKKGIKVVNGGDVKITNCKFKDLDYGILMEEVLNISVINIQISDVICAINLGSCENITISESKISHSEEGINAFLTYDSTISDMEIWNISNRGIYPVYCSDFMITNVRLWNLSNYGIHLHFSSNITISSSRFESQREGYLHITGTPTFSYANHHILHSKINGKPILYYYDLEDMILEDIEAGHIILSSCINVTLNRCNTTGGEGVSFYYTWRCVIKDSVISESSLGLYLYNTMGDYIINNTIEYNGYGCKMFHVEGNTLTGNDFKWNDYGFYLEKSYGNYIFHNNVIDNEKQVIDKDSSMRSNWDNGEEGNYWSNYNGTDLDGDGIGDSAYKVAYHSSDGFPLMYPWGSSPPPDTNPPFFMDFPIITDRNLTLPHENLQLEFATSEKGQYEVIIDIDGNQGFDNTTDFILRGNTTAESQYVTWNGKDTNNNYIEDGDYQIYAMIWDLAGNPISEPYDSGFVSIISDIDIDGIGDVEDSDDDNDGIPDEWEEEYGLNSTNPEDAEEDNDDDGYNNFEEYKAGTNPLDANSKPFTISEYFWMIVLTVIFIPMLITILVMKKLFKKSSPMENEEELSAEGEQINKGELIEEEEHIEEGGNIEGAPEENILPKEEAPKNISVAEGLKDQPPRRLD
jgi:parallel beta-helix repeat protein